MEPNALRHILPPGDSPEVQAARQRYLQRQQRNEPPVLPATRPEVAINMVTDDDGMPYFQRYLDQHWVTYAYASLVDFTKVEALEYLRAMDAGKGLYVVGPTGTGKTHFLVAVFRDRCRREPHLDIAIVPWLDMVDAIRRDIDKPGDQRYESYYFSHLGVLLIDDFGKGQRTPWVMEQMYSIVETPVSYTHLTLPTNREV